MPKVDNSFAGFIVANSTQYDEMCRKLAGDLLDAREALRQIRDMPKESIWRDDRDDAADMMVDIAEDALRGVGV